MTTRRPTSLASLAAALPADGAAVQLLPAGTFRASDGSGRPTDAPHWKLDGAIAARLIARVAAKANPLVIDYEHQTLFAEKNGQPAPAAGWFAGRSLEWRDGQGLFATDPEWTPPAAARIANGEYRYISPVFEYDRQSGEVLDLRMAALTNNPGLTGMAAVALTALNDLSTPEDPMNETLKKLLGAIGLAEDASEADALAAVAALKAKADSLDTQIAALKAQAPDPAKFVPVETMASLQALVAALTARLNDGEVGDVVDAALTAGKLLPAQKDWAVELGKSNLAALKAYVEKTPAIAALQGMQGDDKGAGEKKPGHLAESELAVCKAMGLAADEYLKTRAAA